MKWITIHINNQLVWWLIPAFPQKQKTSWNFPSSTWYLQCLQISKVALYSTSDETTTLHYYHVPAASTSSSIVLRDTSWLYHPTTLEIMAIRLSQLLAQRHWSIQWILLCLDVSLRLSCFQSTDIYSTLTFRQRCAIWIHIFLYHSRHPPLQ